MTRSPDFPFLQAILADHSADGPRLAYADWLEAEGQGARAEAVRLGTRLAPHRKYESMILDPDYRACEARQRELNQQHTETWKQSLPQDPQIMWGDFDGGLADEIYVDDIQAFEQNIGQILDASPVVGYVYRWEPSEEILRRMVGAPDMARVGALYVRGHFVGPGIAHAVAKTESLAGLRVLDVSSNKLTAASTVRLLSAAHLANLRELNLELNEFNSTALKSLPQARHLSNLEFLSVAGNEIGVKGGELLGAAAQLANLRALDVNSCKLGVVGVQRIAESPMASSLERLNLLCNKLTTTSILTQPRRFPKLAWLCLTNNPLKTPGLEKLAAAENFVSLRDLILNYTGLPAKSMRALVGARWVESLERLDLEGNPLGDEGARALATVPFTQLRRLDLANTGIGDEGLAALVRSPGMQELEQLLLYRNPLTDRAVDLLSERGRLPKLRHVSLPLPSLSEQAREKLVARFGAESS